MQKKFCFCCKEEKSSSEFYLKKNGRLHSWCNDCRRNKKKEWDEKNDDYIKIYKKETRGHRLKKDAEYRESRREELRLKSVIYNNKLKDKRKQDRLKPENKIREKERGKKWRESNRERTHAYIKEYYDKDESKRIGRNLRNRLRKVLKGTMGAIHTKEIAGCSLDFLKDYIESLFTTGMSWENYNVWHLDHRLPCSAFNLKDPVHQRACFFFKNLQPMWGAENISKNNNYDINDFNTYMDWFLKNVIGKENDVAA